MKTFTVSFPRFTRTKGTSPFECTTITPARTYTVQARDDRDYDPAECARNLAAARYTEDAFPFLADLTAVEYDRLCESATVALGWTPVDDFDTWLGMFAGHARHLSDDPDICLRDLCTIEEARSAWSQGESSFDFAWAMLKDAGITPRL